MANLPLFFREHIPDTLSLLELEEETARHVVQVLRMKEGTALELTDGKGTVAAAIIAYTGKKSCQVRMTGSRKYMQPSAGLHLCAGFTKNASRNEWLLEKATELGVQSITPLQTSRTEREKFRTDRWRNILVSAMLQSQQSFLPELKPATDLATAIKNYEQTPQKIVAHCLESLPREPFARIVKPGQPTVIIIGPEGDLSPEEISLCTGNGFQPISLCTQRLRTETAAMAVCAYFNLLNHE